MHFFLKIHFTSAWFLHVISILYHFLGKINTLTTGLLLYSYANPWHMLELPRALFCSGTSALSTCRMMFCCLHWWVHLKPISSSTDDGDVNDREQITKALWGGHYFLNTQELFLLYHYLGLRFIKGNRTILFCSHPLPLDTKTWD